MTEAFEREGARLALHAWRPPEARAVVFYLHGTQSHAGWLFQTGPTLAAAGVALYALDRRGSGESDGARGDATTFRVWLDDYRAALAAVRGRHPGLPLTILGQSLGGCLATCLSVEAAPLHEALLLSAPAYDLLHGKLPAERLAALREQRPAAHYPVKVGDEQYTTDPEMLAFMAADARMVRALTGRFLAAQIDLEEAIRALPAGSLARPAALLVGKRDAIIDLAVVRARFETLAPGGRIALFEADDHYLEFSPAREAWWRLVAAFALSGGA